MSALFGTPKVPTVQMPPPPPTISDAMVQAQESDALLKRKMGAGVTLLTSPNGLPNLGTTKVAAPVAYKSS